MPKGNEINIDFESLLKQVYYESVDTHNLPHSLYLNTAEHLTKPIYKAFGVGLDGHNFYSEDKALISELRENIYRFSAAKTYQQVKEVSELLTDGERVLPLSEFREKALDVLGLYNEQYLAAEHDTAEFAARSASKWNKIQADKETLPYLRYSDVDDDHECEICGGLHDMVARVDDEIWDSLMPPNHFFCRCTVEQVDDEEAELSTDIEERYTAAKENMDGTFLMNPGKDKVIYQESGPDKHPYFDVEKKDKAFAASNFNLPIPPMDMAITKAIVEHPMIEVPEEIKALPPTNTGDYKIKRETEKALLITNGEKEMWIQRRWLRANSTLTPTAQAKWDAEKTVAEKKQQWVEDTSINGNKFNIWKPSDEMGRLYFKDKSYIQVSNKEGRSLPSSMGGPQAHTSFVTASGGQASELLPQLEEKHIWSLIPHGIGHENKIMVKSGEKWINIAHSSKNL